MLKAYILAFRASSSDSTMSFLLFNKTGYPMLLKYVVRNIVHFLNIQIFVIYLFGIIEASFLYGKNVCQCLQFYLVFHKEC